MGKQWNQWETLYFWAPKSLQMVTAAMKLRHLLLGRKAMTNLDCILKSRDITLPTKARLVIAMVFPVVMHGCESWTIKSWAPKNWCFWSIGEDSWESLGLQDQTSPSWRKSVLNIHWKDWCWSWNSNTLSTWCEELTYLKRPWCWERLRAGEGDDRGWDGWMASLTQWTWVWVGSGSWWWTRRSGVLAVHGVAKSQTRLSDWTELNWMV